MKRNPILVLGLGVLLSFGVFAVGCGDDAAPKKNDGSADAKKDTGSAGGSIGTGGAKGTGGAIGTGGATGVGGAIGTGGATGVGGATGTGGATGAGGATGVDGGRVLDGGSDVVQGEAGKLDSPADQPIKNDGNEVGNVKLDTLGVDGAGAEVTVVTPVDAAIDQGVDTAALDTAAIEVEIDSGVDGSADI